MYCVWNISDAGEDYILWAAFKWKKDAENYFLAQLETGMIGERELVIVEQDDPNALPTAIQLFLRGTIQVDDRGVRTAQVHKTNT